MRETVAGINPKLLVWARERAGYSLAEVAQALKKEPATIESWESGASAPTYAQLETLAYKVYKRPLALFFFPAPPDEPDPEHAFRTLPDFEIEDLSADTRFKIRDARAMQLALYNLNAGVNPAPRKIFRDLRVRSSRPSAAAIAADVRSYLGIDIQTQREEWRKPDEALKAWRTVIEDAGIFVFKNSFKQREVSGFCLYDEEFPIIYLNNSTTPTRQIFTLLHELAHLLFQTSGITKLDDRYIQNLSGEARRIEVFCNVFAAEFLVPASDLLGRARDLVPTLDTISRFAKEYKVSREVVLIRLFDLGLVSRSFLDETMSTLQAQYEGRSQGDGGNYYATQATYLGDSFLRLAFGRYYQGVISLQQLADFLNIKASSVPGLEPFVLQKAAS